MFDTTVGYGPEAIEQSPYPMVPADFAPKPVSGLGGCGCSGIRSVGTVSPDGLGVSPDGLGDASQMSVRRAPPNWPTNWPTTAQAYHAIMLDFGVWKARTRQPNAHFYQFLTNIAAGRAPLPHGFPRPTWLGTHGMGAYGDGGAGQAIVGVVALASAAASAYHGYKRNHDSVGWAIGWGLLGGLFPVITPVIAVAQGYAKPEKGA